MCLALGKTPEELGEYREQHPLGFEFLEQAMRSRMRVRGRNVSATIRTG